MSKRHKIYSTNIYLLFKNSTTITSDDFDLLEGLTTGHFDAKNKLVRNSCLILVVIF